MLLHAVCFSPFTAYAVAAIAQAMLDAQRAAEAAKRARGGKKGRKKKGKKEDDKAKGDKGKDGKKKVVKTPVVSRGSSYADGPVCPFACVGRC